MDAILNLSFRILKPTLICICRVASIGPKLRTKQLKSLHLLLNKQSRYLLNFWFGDLTGQKFNLNFIISLVKVTAANIAFLFPTHYPCSQRLTIEINDYGIL